MMYRAKVCIECGQEYQPTCSTQKWCSNCGPKEKKKVRNRCSKQWALANPERVRELGKRSASAHPEQVKENKRRWTFVHPEQKRAQDKAWVQSHPEKVRIGQRKMKAKRRLLGFNPLNSWFVGCEGHHVTHDDVIHIPVELHMSVRHNIWTGHNMEQVNALAYEWLAQQVKV